MRKTIFFSILLAIPGDHSSAAAQSLADAAREARDSKQLNNPRGAQRKVYTNETLAASSHEDPASEKKPSDRQPQTTSVKKTTALQWKAAIASQKNAVEALQAQIEKAEKSIQFVTANGHSNGPQHNAEQKKSLDQLVIAKKKLEQEKQKLEEMKETARKEGFSSVVYEP